MTLHLPASMKLDLSDREHCRFALHAIAFVGTCSEDVLDLDVAVSAMEAFRSESQRLPVDQVLLLLAVAAEEADDPNNSAPVQEFLRGIPGKMVDVPVSAAA